MKIRINNEYYNYYRKNSETHSLDRKEFTIAINFLNTTIVDLVLRGKKVNLPNLGTLQVVEKTRRRPMVDFPTTNANKKILLEEGKTIFKQWKDEDGNVVNNNGEHYLTYFDDTSYYHIVLGGNHDKVYNSKGTRYNFKPVKGFIKTLNQEIKEGDLKLLLW